MDTTSHITRPHDHAVPFDDPRAIFAVLAKEKQWPAFLARALAADAVKILQVESLAELENMCRQSLRVAVYLGDDLIPLPDLLRFIRGAATHQPRCFVIVGTRSEEIRGIATEAGAQAVIGSLEEAHLHLRQIGRFLGHSPSAPAIREGHNNQ